MSLHHVTFSFQFLKNHICLENEITPKKCNFDQKYVGIISQEGMILRNSFAVFKNINLFNGSFF